MVYQDKSVHAEFEAKRANGDMYQVDVACLAFASTHAGLHPLLSLVMSSQLLSRQSTGERNSRYCAPRPSGLWDLSDLQGAQRPEGLQSHAYSQNDSDDREALADTFHT